MLNTVTAVETGTKPGYEDYHGEFLDAGYKKIGGWNYDKKQGLYIGSLDNVRKNFYHRSVTGLTLKISNYLNNH